MTMIVTNINEVKARLSEYLEAVSRGERVVICKRNTPIAELRAIVPVRTELRKVGGAAGRMTVRREFLPASTRGGPDRLRGRHSCRRGLHCRREAPVALRSGSNSPAQVTEEIVKLLLDTCTFLWIASSPAVVPPNVLQQFRNPENDVFLSAASSWEIAIKHGLGRLVLPEPPERFVPAEREAHGIAPLPIDEESTLHLSRLPALHRDPFDRLLVSQAIVHGLTIVTPDPLVTQYPARTLW